jgi:hypothetical protein
MAQRFQPCDRLRPLGMSHTAREQLPSALLVEGRAPSSVHAAQFYQAADSIFQSFVIPTLSEVEREEPAFPRHRARTDTAETPQPDSSPKNKI